MARSAFAQCCGIHVFALNKLKFSRVAVPFYMLIGNIVSIFSMSSSVCLGYY